MVRESSSISLRSVTSSGGPCCAVQVALTSSMLRFGITPFVWYTVTCTKQMQTRMQKRIAITHEVLFCRDLLNIIQGHVRGSRRRRLIAFQVIPCVCKTWTLAFNDCKVRYLKGLPLYESPFQYGQMHAFVCQFPMRLAEATRHLRPTAAHALNCYLDGVPTLLGSAIIEVAFAFHTPVNTARVPLRYWEFIFRLRHWLAIRILRKRTDFPPVSPFLTLTQTDPLHIALGAGQRVIARV